MPHFFHSWGPFGPSGRVEATDLDDACTLVHAHLDSLGMTVTARHLPPEDASTDPCMPWQGVVLVVRSPQPRYGDNAQLHIAVYEQGQTSYHDKSRQRLEEKAAHVYHPPYPVA